MMIIIKLNIKKVSFLIFEKGPVNITGVKNINDLLESYEFIKNLLLENKEILNV